MKGFTYRENLICIILAICPTFFIESILKVDLQYHTIGNSIISFAVFGGIYFLWKKIFLQLDKKLGIISVVLGFVFSIFMVCGSNIIMLNATYLKEVKTWLEILFIMPLFMAMVAFAILYLPRLNKSFAENPFEKCAFAQVGLKKYFLICWGLIFIAWIPGLIASYPGIYAYDCVFQIQMYQNETINLHHPLIHTYLLAFCVLTLGEWFGNIQIGFLIYCIVQMIILAAAFALICKYMAEKKVAFLIRLVTLIIFMFLPVNAIMSFSGTKDVLYAAFFTIFIYLLFQMAQNPHKVLYEKSFLIKFILVSLLNTAFRNQGKYVFIFGMVFTIVLLYKHWKRLVPLTIACLVVFAIYSGPITQLARGQSYKTREVREMMSVPCMQLSRAMNYAQDQISEEEKQLIAQYIPDYAIYPWSEAISDPMKNTFNSERFLENPMEFIKLWVSVGLKTPMVYIDAFARQTIGLWYPDMNYRDSQAYHPYWEYVSTEQDENGEWLIVERSTPNAMKWLSDFYYDITYNNTYQNIPMVSMLFSSGILIWCLLIYFAICVYYKNYTFIVPGVFVLGLWLTLLLGPVVLYRYVFPIAMVVPLLLSTAITNIKKDKRG